jgi:hypothetical protein
MVIYGRRGKKSKEGEEKMGLKGMRRKGEEKQRMRSKRMWRCRGEEDYEKERSDEGIKTRHVLHCGYVRRCFCARRA